MSNQYNDNDIYQEALNAYKTYIKNKQTYFSCFSSEIKETPQMLRLKYVLENEESDLHCLNAIHTFLRYECNELYKKDDKINTSPEPTLCKYLIETLNKKLPNECWGKWEDWNPLYHQCFFKEKNQKALKKMQQFVLKHKNRNIKGSLLEDFFNEYLNHKKTEYILVYKINKNTNSNADTDIFTLEYQIDHIWYSINCLNQHQNFISPTINKHFKEQFTEKKQPVISNQTPKNFFTQLIDTVSIYNTTTTNSLIKDTTEIKNKPSSVDKQRSEKILDLSAEERAKIENTDTTSNKKPLSTDIQQKLSKILQDVVDKYEDNTKLSLGILHGGSSSKTGCLILETIANASSFPVMLKMLIQYIKEDNKSGMRDKSSLGVMLSNALDGFIKNNNFNETRNTVRNEIKEENIHIPYTSFLFFSPFQTADNCFELKVIEKTLAKIAGLEKDKPSLLDNHNGNNNYLRLTQTGA